MRRSLSGYIVLGALLFTVLTVPSAGAVGDPTALATVAFGAWQSGPLPLDRFDTPTDRTRNDNVVIPRELTIKAGGAVNFVIGGFHVPAIYGPGTRPGDIDTGTVIPGPPAAIIDDENERIFRGLDPRTQSQDRVETVRFADPGTYLVICAIHPHFVNAGMYGFVRVLP